MDCSPKMERIEVKVKKRKEKQYGWKLVRERALDGLVARTR